MKVVLSSVPRRTLLAAAIVAGVLPFASAAFSNADEDAIRAQTVAFSKAYNAYDAKAVAAGYADDALLLPSGAPPARGKAAILEFFKGDTAALKAESLSVNISTKTDVGVSGNIGWESGTYTITQKGQTIDTGKFLSVSRKADGKWLYIRDTWNSDVPPPPAPPAPAAPVAPVMQKK